MTFSLRDPRQPGYCRLAEEEALHLGLITLDDLIPAHMREREHAEDEAFLAERARGWRPIDERFAQYADDDGFVSSFVIEQIEREERRACRQRAAQQRAAQQRAERKHRAKARRAAHRRAKSRRLDARQVQRTDPAVDTLAAGTDNDPAAATLPLPRPDQVEPVAPGEPGAPASPGSAGSAGSAGGADQVACLRAMIELLADVDGRDGGCTAATRIDLIAVCEQLKGSLSAAQARVSVAFADAQADAAEAAGESVRAAQRGIAPQLAFARQCSPATADQHLSQAQALTSVLPHTLQALTRGAITPAQASAVHAATTGLSPEQIEALDERLADRLPVLSYHQLKAAAAQIAAEINPAAVVERHSRAVRERGAWTRPAPDGMAYLTILGKLSEIVGAFAALKRHATAVVAGHVPNDPLNDRSYSAVLADTALARISGLAPGEAHPVAVTLVMTPENLFGKTANDVTTLFTPTPPAAPETGKPATAEPEPCKPEADTTPESNTTAEADTTSATAAEPTPAGSAPEEAATRRPRATPAHRQEAPPADQPVAAEEATPKESPDPAAASPVKEATAQDCHIEGAATHAESTRVDPTATEDGIATEDSVESQPTAPEPGPGWHRPGEGTRCRGANTPVRVLGHGTIPAAIVRDWLLAGCDNPDFDPGNRAHPDHGDHPDHPDPAGRPTEHAGPHPAAVTLQRAFTSPDGRDLIALESLARLFPPPLRSLLILRDDRCRMPFCEADIRHADHIRPATEGGPTSYGNGQGLSARCNYTKDLPGFTTRVLTPAEIAAYAAGPETDRNTHIAREAGPDTHVTAVTTPTGHTYLSAAPPALGWGQRRGRRDVAARWVGTSRRRHPAP